MPYPAVHVDCLAQTQEYPVPMRGFVKTQIRHAHRPPDRPGLHATGLSVLDPKLAVAVAGSRRDLQVLNARIRRDPAAEEPEAPGPANLDANYGRLGTALRVLWHGIAQCNGGVFSSNAPNVRAGLHRRRPIHTHNCAAPCINLFAFGLDLN